jgi:hypothetical protein
MAIILAIVALCLAGALLIHFRSIALPWEKPIAGRAAGAGRMLRAAPALAVPPRVEPPILLEMTPEQAREFNATIPFMSSQYPPARPFLFGGAPQDRERALTCLASAAWYEAGDDPSGQQAVVQVVLNRLRHPAFPKTVCGVIFQGAERKTGCQFTFTCDGSLARTPSADAWRRARAVAEEALNGYVMKKVGTATHYHTDWVVPYWSASLDKLTAVHTHLFFRWRGGWGRPAAFSGRYQGPEQLDPRIAALSNGGAATLLPYSIAETAAFAAAQGPARPELAIDGVPSAQLKGNKIRLASPDPAEYVLELDPSAYAGSYAMVALKICRDLPVCSVMGWIKPEQVPDALPVPKAALHSVSFIYRRNRQLNREQIYWNCQQTPRTDASQCLPGTGEQANSASS